jgi:nitroimidazol reductase NimA-like FMN-containing flavoprotein (pyridoxamine 5'-phosphate oxidase superfamily)
MNTEPQAGVTVLGVPECWNLLRSVEIGRLAVSVGDHPDIFPINFLVDHGTIVFRTAEGTKLAALATSHRVAFEVDGVEPELGEAWSVVLKGRAAELKAFHDIIETATFPLFPWHAGPKSRFVRIVPEQISGRRFHVVNSDVWRTPITGIPNSPSE